MVLANRGEDEFSGLRTRVKNTVSPQLPAQALGRVVPRRVAVNESVEKPAVLRWQAAVLPSGARWEHFVRCSLPGEFPPRYRGSLCLLQREQDQEEQAKVVPSHAQCLARRGNKRLMLLHVAAVVLGDFSPCCRLAVPAGILDYMALSFHAPESNLICFLSSLFCIAAAERTTTDKGRKQESCGSDFPFYLW